MCQVTDEPDSIISYDSKKITVNYSKSSIKASQSKLIFFLPIHDADKRKIWIAGLLLFSVLITAFLLANSDPVQVKTLHSESQLDSLITDTFAEFRVTPQMIREQSVEVDSLFTRVIYSVRVPNSFSKTSFHLQLNKKLNPYRVDTNGVVIFPEEHLRIHLLSNHKVVRTVELLSSGE